MASGRLSIPRIDPIFYNGEPVVGATLTVYENLTTTLAPIFQDPGLTTALANPQTSNAQGGWDTTSEFIWADASKWYNVVVQLPSSAGGGTIPFENVALLTDGGFASEFATVAALRSSITAPTATVNLRGYYAPGDGGGGSLYLDAADTTTADNGATVFVNAGGQRIKRVASGSLSLEQAGAVGDNSTDDKTAIQRALDSGVKLITGTPGKTYTVSHTGTFTVFTSTLYRYAVLLRSGVLLDGRGATFKLRSGQNSSIFAANGTDGAGLINAVLDCDRANQGLTPTGDQAGVMLHNTDNSRLENLTAIRCRQYAGRFLNNRTAYFDKLHCTGSDGDGWALGIGGGWQLFDSTIGLISATACLQVYPDLEGNGIVGCLVRCDIDTLRQHNCWGGIKIQDDTDTVSIGKAIVTGNAGVGNSGLKVQGAGSNRPANVQVGSVLCTNQAGNGLYTNEVMSLQIGEYRGSGNGAGSTVTGTDKMDARLHAASGGVISIGSLNGHAASGGGISVEGSGAVEIKSCRLTNVVGVGVTSGASAGARLLVSELTVLGSGITNALFHLAGGGRCAIDTLITDRIHDVSTGSIPIKVSAIAGLSDRMINITIEKVIMGNSALAGIVSVAAGDASTAVAAPAAFRQSLGSDGGVNYWFEPMISLRPANSGGTALTKDRGFPRTVVARGDDAVASGFTIYHNTGTGTQLFGWEVGPWRVINGGFEA